MEGGGRDGKERNERRKKKKSRKKRLEEYTKQPSRAEKKQKRTINAFGFFFCTNIFLGFSTRIKKPSYLTEAMFNQ